jgi:hypothetical protein
MIESLARRLGFYKDEVAVFEFFAGLLYSVVPFEVVFIVVAVVVGGLSGFTLDVPVLPSVSVPSVEVGEGLLVTASQAVMGTVSAALVFELAQLRKGVPPEESLDMDASSAE